MNQHEPFYKETKKKKEKKFEDEDFFKDQYYLQER
jgi:hypothetical protein